ncbi:MAG: ABC transporter ATP-binding protein [Steroidobacteraceae bacterium]
MNVTQPVLVADALRITAGARLLVDALQLLVRPGQFIAVLGRNGSGKSLTLATLAGLRATQAGSVALAGKSFKQQSRRAIARQLAFLPQDREAAFATTVLEHVLIARHPHLKLWQHTDAADEALARAALHDVGLTGFETRSMATLSGGEQRRAAIAGLLVQESQLYLLDEPTNHLDPHHQVQILELFRARCARGASVIATLHEPTMAARYADFALLLAGDGGWRFGHCDDALSAASLTDLYGVPMLEVNGAGRRVFAPC